MVVYSRARGPNRQGHKLFQMYHISRAREIIEMILKCSTNDRPFLSYTWRHPCGSKRLVWAISGYMEEFFNELKSDDFKIIQLEEDKLVGWVSFLDGMQRILLFTEDVNLCYKVSVFAAVDRVYCSFPRVRYILYMYVDMSFILSSDVIHSNGVESVDT